ncbi:hypothetical protein AAG570_008658 [Ranatra chinensis]|uniref:Uncharacterized protein n=1 Tax=Ranatra chinensis TaxID=642074 RepID=A0ABD0YRU2_9HEMI
MKLIKFNTINPRVEEVDENPDQTFYEEEYSYEPELKQSSSKVVLRTRSLLNLDEDINTTLNNVVKKSVGGNKHKITTGPDGTFRFGGRKATSEMNLSDESRPNSTKTSPKSVRHCSGEELRKRKEEIFRNKNSKSEININKYNEEINSNNSETTKARALSNLKKYLQGRNIGLREILVNNNVVIIEPVRSEGSQTDVSEYNHRITGTKTKPGCPKEANKKSPEANTLPRVSKPFQTAIQRHFFYHQGIKTNRELKDEELPDPDKVRNARQMFQNVVKVTPEVRVIDCPKSSKEKLDKSTETDTKHDILKRILNKKWTDTGSLSSGVSSDMSCFDNELDCNDMASQKEMFSSEELDTHPVSPEVMNKIRACGTSVTYYGGRVISHTDGPARSPMTMTIMDEIRQNGDQYMGVKFRLVKSNSCGSRLELAGTAEEPIHEQTSHCRHHEDIYGPAKTLSEELAECRGRMEPIEDLEPQDEKPAREMFNKAQKMFQEKSKSNCNKQPVQSWRALIESRKQNRSMESHRPCPDMEFEEFEVLEG